MNSFLSVESKLVVKVKFAAILSLILTSPCPHSLGPAP